VAHKRKRRKPSTPAAPGPTPSHSPDPTPGLDAASIRFVGDTAPIGGPDSAISEDYLDSRDNRNRSRRELLATDLLFVGLSLTLSLVLVGFLLLAVSLHQRHEKSDPNNRKASQPTRAPVPLAYSDRYHCTVFSNPVLKSTMG